MDEERQKIILGSKKDTGLSIYEERFRILMKLIRIERMMKRAKDLNPKI